MKTNWRVLKLAGMYLSVFLVSVLTDGWFRSLIGSLIKTFSRAFRVNLVSFFSNKKSLFVELHACKTHWHVLFQYQLLQVIINMLLVIYFKLFIFYNILRQQRATNILLYTRSRFREFYYLNFWYFVPCEYKVNGKLLLRTDVFIARWKVRWKTMKQHRFIIDKMLIFSHEKLYNLKCDRTIQ